MRVLLNGINVLRAKLKGNEEKEEIATKQHVRTHARIYDKPVSLFLLSLFSYVCRYRKSTNSNKHTRK